MTAALLKAGADPSIPDFFGNTSMGDAQPVRSFVRKLRRKLGEHPKRPAYILNERGLG